MARPKDSIQKLLDKGFLPDEIVKQGKYSQQDVDQYLNTANTDATETHSSDDTDEESELEAAKDNADDTLISTENGSDLNAEKLRSILNETGEEAQEMGDTKFNPGVGATVSSTERGYTQIKSDKVIDEVPRNYEPIKHGQTVTTDNPASSSTTNDGATGTAKPSEPLQTYPNPALVDAPENKKREAAERLYDRIVVPVYEKLCLILPLVCKFSENKIRKLSAKNEIDLDMLLGFFNSKGVLTETTLKEVIAEHNQEADKAFEFDQKFVDDAREPTIREFIKRGWGIAEDDELKWILIEKGLDWLQQMVIFNIKKYGILGEAKLFVLERNKEKNDEQQRAESQRQSQQRQPPPPPPPQFSHAEPQSHAHAHAEDEITTAEVINE